MCANCFLLLRVKELRALCDFESHVSAVKKLAELKSRLMFAKSYRTGDVFMEFKQDMLVRKKVLEKTNAGMEVAPP